MSILILVSGTEKGHKWVTVMVAGRQMDVWNRINPSRLTLEDRGWRLIKWLIVLLPVTSHLFRSPVCH